MPKITAERLNEYFTSNGQYYPLWKDANDLYDGLRVHADGTFPTKLIKDRRPSEPLEIVAYREKVYKPITKLPISKVISSFGKIRRSPDWMIKYPDQKVGGIPDEETLEEYCTNKLPGYGSITNWAFEILLKQNLIDPNAVVAVFPMKEIVDNEFTMPVPIVFNSDQVIEYKEREQYCILRSKRKVAYMDQADMTKQGDIFYYVDDKEILIYEQTKDGYAVKTTIKNTIGRMPVFKVKAEAFKQFDNMALSRSRLDAMIPFLDEAACEYSDLMGSKIQHLYPLFWYYMDQNCVPCKGLGETTGANGKKKCLECEGTGKVKFSPFAHLRVSPPSLGKAQSPTPPAGYVTRDTAILELQEKSVEKNLFKAQAAINMQFLDQTPLAISGDAKNVDREELNNTVYTTAEDLIYSIDKTLELINEWRNVYFVKDQAKRKALLPNIPVPQNFDLLPEDYLMKEVTDARAAKITPFLIATLEQELAAKKFYNNPDLAKNMELYFELDPLPGITVDDKLTQLQNGGITKEDFVISSNLAAFIKRAMRDVPKFAEMTWEQQMTKIKEYAKEKTDANDEAQQMIQEQQKKQAIIAEMQNPGGNKGGTPPAKTA